MKSRKSMNGGVKFSNFFSRKRSHELNRLTPAELNKFNYEQQLRLAAQNKIYTTNINNANEIKNMVAKNRQNSNNYEKRRKAAKAIRNAEYKKKINSIQSGETGYAERLNSNKAHYNFVMGNVVNTPNFINHENIYSTSAKSKLYPNTNTKIYGTLGQPRLPPPRLPPRLPAKLLPKQYNNNNEFANTGNF